MLGKKLPEGITISPTRKQEEVSLFGKNSGTLSPIIPRRTEDHIFMMFMAIITITE
jgi:hypothetical protein